MTARQPEFPIIDEALYNLRYRFFGDIIRVNMFILLSLLLRPSMDSLYFDSCSLIYLTKIGMKELLPSLGYNVFLGTATKEEVTRETEKYAEAKILKGNIEKKIIQEVSLEKPTYPFPISLGKGEREMIDLCLSMGGIPVTDDHQALNYARSRGLSPKTTEILLLRFLEEKIIALNEFRQKFNKLAIIKNLKPGIVNFIYQKANSIAEQLKPERQGK